MGKLLLEALTFLQPFSQTKHLHKKLKGTKRPTKSQNKIYRLLQKPRRVNWCSLKKRHRVVSPSIRSNCFSKVLGAHTRTCSILFAGLRSFSRTLQWHSKSGSLAIGVLSTRQSRRPKYQQNRKHDFLFFFLHDINGI